MDIKVCTALQNCSCPNYSMLWYLNIIFQLLFDIIIQVSLPEIILNDINWYLILVSIRSIISISTRAHAAIGVRLVLILVSWQTAFTWGTGGWRWPAGITYKYFSPSAPTVPHPASSFTLLSLPSVLSLSRSPRAIHQRESTGVLAFPFFGCSNELAVSLVTLSLLPLLTNLFVSVRPSSCRGLLTFPSLPFSSSRSVYDWDFIYRYSFSVQRFAMPEHLFDVLIQWITWLSVQLLIDSFLLPVFHRFKSCGIKYYDFSENRSYPTMILNIFCEKIGFKSRKIS